MIRWWMEEKEERKKEKKVQELRGSATIQSVDLKQKAQTRLSILLPCIQHKLSPSYHSLRQIYIDKPAISFRRQSRN